VPLGVLDSVAERVRTTVAVIDLVVRELALASADRVCVLLALELALVEPLGAPDTDGAGDALAESEFVTESEPGPPAPALPPPALGEPLTLELAQPL